LYTGCDYCHEGLQVYLHLFTPKEAADLSIEPTGKFEPENGYSWLNFSIVDTPDLLKALPKLDQPDMEHYDKLSDWLEDNGRDLLRDGAVISCKEQLNKRPHN